MFTGSIYKILIASPGDVGEERQAIVDVVDAWNTVNAELRNVVLLPVRWESHTAPLLGDRPQAVINDQIVKSCDLLIGVFWTRLGTPTGVSESGTVEEIEWFIKNEKPVMLYFSSRQVDPRKLDIDQYKALKTFEEAMRKLGLTGAYENLTDFRERLFQQLSMNINRLLSGESFPKPSVEEQKKKNKELSEMISREIYLEDYEKDGKIRSFLVKGETRKLKDNLKALGGKWNPTLGGWIFPKTKEIEVAELIKRAG